MSKFVSMNRVIGYDDHRFDAIAEALKVDPWRILKVVFRFDDQKRINRIEIDIDQVTAQDVLKEFAP